MFSGVWNNSGWRVSACTDFPKKNSCKFLEREKSFSGFEFLTGKTFPGFFLPATNPVLKLFEAAED